MKPRWLLAIGLGEPALRQQSRIKIADRLSRLNNRQPHPGVATAAQAADRVTARRIKLRNECLTAVASSNFKIPYQRTGFVPFAESLNGRLAMLGFVIAIATEALSGKGILGQLGLG